MDIGEPRRFVFAIVYTLSSCGQRLRLRMAKFSMGEWGEEWMSEADRQHLGGESILVGSSLKRRPDCESVVVSISRVYY